MTAATAATNQQTQQTTKSNSAKQAAAVGLPLSAHLAVHSRTITSLFGGCRRRLGTDGEKAATTALAASTPLN